MSSPESQTDGFGDEKFLSWLGNGYMSRASGKDSISSRSQETLHSTAASDDPFGDDKAESFNSVRSNTSERSAITLRPASGSTIRRHPKVASPIGPFDPAGFSSAKKRLPIARIKVSFSKASDSSAETTTADPDLGGDGTLDLVKPMSSYQPGRETSLKEGRELQSRFHQRAAAWANDFVANLKEKRNERRKRKESNRIAKTSLKNDGTDRKNKGSGSIDGRSENSPAKSPSAIHGIGKVDWIQMLA